MNKPSSIFKYEPFTSRSLRNLKSQSLYFGSPLNFNDPYDCALKAGIKEPSSHEVEKLRTYYYESTDIPEQARKELENADTELLKKIIIKTTKVLISEQTDSFLKTKGVSCFSENHDNLLMWSHYGGRYKGFCLEFNTKYEPFSKIRKVEYTETMPKIDAVSLLLNDDNEQYLNLFCTKSELWRYEKEWRCIHHHAGTQFTYEAPALEAVYFGPDIDRQSMEIICLILAGQNPNVKLWKGTRSEELFEVKFEKFSYMNYVEAKKRGLVT